MQNPAVSIWVGKRKSCHLTLSFHKSKPYQKGQFLNWQLKWGSAERTFEVLSTFGHLVIWGTNSIGQFKKNFFQEEFVFQKEDCFFHKEDCFFQKEDFFFAKNLPRSMDTWKCRFIKVNFCKMTVWAIFKESEQVCTWRYVDCRTHRILSLPTKKYSNFFFSQNVGQICIVRWPVMQLF